MAGPSPAVRPPPDTDPGPWGGYFMLSWLGISEMIGRRASSSHLTRIHRYSWYPGGGRPGDGQDCWGNRDSRTERRPAARAHPGGPVPTPCRAALPRDLLLPLLDRPKEGAGSGAPPAGRGRSCPPGPALRTAPSRLLSRGGRAEKGSWLLPWRAWLPWRLGSAPRPSLERTGPAAVASTAEDEGARSPSSAPAQPRPLDPPSLPPAPPPLQPLRRGRWGSRAAVGTARARRGREARGPLQDRSRGGAGAPPTRLPGMRR